MSNAAAFSPSFRKFVRENIASVEQVDVLLLLHARPDRAWRVAEISKELASTESSIVRRVAVLSRRRLAARDPDGRYRYLSSEATNALVEELQSHYTVRPTRLIDLIYSQRTNALEAFSDAFLLDSEDLDG